MLRNKISELFRHSAMYSIGWISSSVASILLLPIYTAYLSKTDYGILEILEYANAFFRLIVLAGFHISIAKFYNTIGNDKYKKEVVSTAILFVAIAGFTILLVAVQHSQIIAQLLLGSEEYSRYVKISLMVLYGDVVFMICASYFSTIKKSATLILYSIGRLILAIIANLVFIVGFKYQALGMLYGSLVAMTTSAIIVIIHVLSANGIRFNFNIWTKMIRFGTPMVPAALAATLMHNADRFIMRTYCSLSDVGLYALGYKFPFMLNVLLLQSFNMIWNGATMYEIAKENDASYQFGKIATYYMMVYVTCQLALSVLAVPLVRVLANVQYFESHKVIPLVSLGLCFHALYTFFTVGAYIKGKVWLLNISYIPAAAVNIVANIWFLPKYGFMAAAWITVLTYFVFSAFAYFTCRKTLRISFEWSRLFRIFGFAASVFLLGMLVETTSAIVQVVKGLVLLFAYCMILAKWGGMTSGESLFVREKFYEIKGMIIKNV